MCERERRRETGRTRERGHIVKHLHFFTLSTNNESTNNERTRERGHIVTHLHFFTLSLFVDSLFVDVVVCGLDRVKKCKCV